ncbi:DMT family transporter [Frigidibacter sp. ROC022]|uniref:DMT family transporter n=1 Tax=Frigidibacter sp. ROC022 TaxID=2971796 RepID=UPI00215AD404|nr:DMT family transporter [Frigidibacter sp. ROC022]MCR8726717.1 DMT family transporter [Frigidibacter sp. ROC022]
MTGELLALLAALAYGVAGVAIVRGKATAQGDNGVFLSVLATAVLTFALWLGWGRVPPRELADPAHALPLAVFALAGLFSIAFGRQTMYRATERIGAVRASLLRRLTPVFALPFAYLLLAQLPGARTILGGAVIVAGVLFYRPGSDRTAGDVPAAGVLLGIASAAFYAAAYTLRRFGMDWLPDAALGACIGALTGCLWFVAGALLRRDRGQALRRLLADRGRWHWLTALSLSIGQTLQFFALKSAAVAVVAVIGTMEVFFSAALVMAMGGVRAVPIARLAPAAALAAIGTALLLL